MRYYLICKISFRPLLGLPPPKNFSGFAYRHTISFLPIAFITVTFHASTRFFSDSDNADVLKLIDQTKEEKLVFLLSFFYVVHRDVEPNNSKLEQENCSIALSL